MARHRPRISPPTSNASDSCSRVIDEEALIEGFQKIANRITLGLLLASLIVGAALLMRVTTSFTILGYPGLAMIFFLLAAASGIWLAVSILTGDRPRHKRASG
jgi:ubiquinone biosynthesis protein